MRFIICGLLWLVVASTQAQEPTDPGERLYGEWEVVEMIYKTKPQDFGGGNGGWFIFEKGVFIRVLDAQQRDEVKRGGPAKKSFCLAHAQFGSMILIFSRMSICLKHLRRPFGS